MKLKVAEMSDVPQIKRLMSRAIQELQAGFLTPEQIEASRGGMGLDTQLIQDQTYYCVWIDDVLAGCGGWSFRATLYGGNHSAGRDATRLNPKVDNARIRAMYTHPEFVRRGIGRKILKRSEQAARAAGFLQLEMAATLAGEPFYLSCGYRTERRWQDERGSVPFPLLTMVKPL